MDRTGSRIRRWVGLLLALNLGVLAVGLGFAYWPRQARFPPELNGDKVRFLSTPDDVAPSLPAHEMPVQAGSAPAPAPAAAKPRVPVCLSWKSLDADQFSALEAHPKQAGIPPNRYVLALTSRLGWWVFLPPLPNARAARAAMDDLRQKGVTDMAPVRGGRMANAVSLGAFPSVDKARQHAAHLAARGVDGAKIGPRPEAGEVRLTFTGRLSNAAAEAMERKWPPGLKPEDCAAP